MEKTSQRKLNDALRARYVDRVKSLLESVGDEVKVVGSNQLAVPCVDDESNEAFVVITLKVPTGTREGEPYDGYAAADDYTFKLIEKAKKAERAKAEKAKKIERDRKVREAKAKAKAKAKAEKEKAE